MLCLCCVLQAEQLSQEMDELTSVSRRKKSIARAQAYECSASEHGEIVFG